MSFLEIMFILIMLMVVVGLIGHAGVEVRSWKETGTKREDEEESKTTPASQPKE